MKIKLTTAKKKNTKKVNEDDEWNDLANFRQFIDIVKYAGGVGYLRFL